MDFEEYRDMVNAAVQDYMDTELEQLDRVDSDIIYDVCSGTEFSLVEAAQVIAEFADNVEDDGALWAGSSPQDAIQAQAFWSFNNDVYFEVDRILESLPSVGDIVMDEHGYTGEVVETRWVCGDIRLSVLLDTGEQSEPVYMNADDVEIVLPEPK